MILSMASSTLGGSVRCGSGWLSDLGLAGGPYWSQLGGGYPQIPLLQFLGIGGCLWYYEECAV